MIYSSDKSDYDSGYKVSNIIYNIGISSTHSSIYISFIQAPKQTTCFIDDFQ